MNRGFALLAVLWLLALLSGLLATAAAVLDTERQAAHNRLFLTRAAWAAEACVAVATERWLVDSVTAPDTVDLGRGVRCTWSFGDPDLHLDVNRVGRDMLARLFRAHGLADSAAEVLAARVLRRTRTTAFDDTLAFARLGIPPGARRHLGTDATSGVSIMAPPQVLAAAGLSREAIAVILERRALGVSVTSLAELSALVPAGIGDDRALAALLRFAPDPVLLTAVGWIQRERSPRARVELLVRRAGERVAVLRRRVA